MKVNASLVVNMLLSVVLVQILEKELIVCVKQIIMKLMNQNVKHVNILVYHVYHKITVLLVLTLIEILLNVLHLKGFMMQETNKES